MVKPLWRGSLSKIEECGDLGVGWQAGDGAKPASG
jgi:hypothetical protein